MCAQPGRPLSPRPPWGAACAPVVTRRLLHAGLLRCMFTSASPNAPQLWGAQFRGGRCYRPQSSRRLPAFLSRQAPQSLQLNAFPVAKATPAHAHSGRDCALGTPETGPATAPPSARARAAAEASETGAVAARKTTTPCRYRAPSPWVPSRGPSAPNPFSVPAAPAGRSARPLSALTTPPRPRAPSAPTCPKARNLCPSLP
ncbi:hypothetical protein P7K49_036846 [Saguinus oedipus]|uniref:Uncharacterized protein n=1 Tax=Saguinus oedipus TaxID=9490 RepID=A0ABQ9TLA8_SAGOE|nr:hypothetical protein P7K49_036846 [Saguinus oedipus]